MASRCISATPRGRIAIISKRLKALTKRTGTPWLCDHLCWGSVDGRYTHDLLPMPYTWEAVEWTARNIREVQDFIGIPVAVENVSSYVEFHASEMTEWEFLNEVVERADCGILLDVNNIYVSSKNHNFDPYLYLDAVPRIASRRFTSPGIRSSSAISSILTIIRCSILSGRCMRTPSSASAAPPPCSSGTIASLLSMKCIARL